MVKLYGLGISYIVQHHPHIESFYWLSDVCVLLLRYQHIETYSVLDFIEVDTVFIRMDTAPRLVATLELTPCLTVSEGK